MPGRESHHFYLYLLVKFFLSFPRKLHVIIRTPTRKDVGCCDLARGLASYVLRVCHADLHWYVVLSSTCAICSELLTGERSDLRQDAATDPRKLHRLASSRKYPKQGTKKAVVIFT